ncbi:hypothetical protein PG999_005510 [Apiospora kogelbergensis]|uniref:Uncharacterized protein n=1 Tax=Apiospora kogelbergensis TaxID=1337665 RepID=A0AAW0R2A2_9PEZI
MGNKPIIVLTSPEKARDLLDTRGHIYSSRPESYISDISSGRLHFADMANSRTPRASDPQLARLHECFAEWSALQGQTMTALADICPVLRYLPDTLFPARRRARGSYRKQLGIFLGRWDGARGRILSGAGHTSSKPKKEAFSGELAAFICGILLTAGSDTVAVAPAPFAAGSCGEEREAGAGGFA